MSSSIELKLTSIKSYIADWLWDGFLHSSVTGELTADYLLVKDIGGGNLWSTSGSGAFGLGGCGGSALYNIENILDKLTGQKVLSIKSVSVRMVGSVTITESVEALVASLNLSLNSKRPVGWSLIYVDSLFYFGQNSSHSFSMDLTQDFPKINVEGQYERYWKMTDIEGEKLYPRFSTASGIEIDHEKWGTNRARCDYLGVIVNYTLPSVSTYSFNSETDITGVAQQYAFCDLKGKIVNAIDSYVSYGFQCRINGVGNWENHYIGGDIDSDSFDFQHNYQFILGTSIEYRTYATNGLGDYIYGNIEGFTLPPKITTEGVSNILSSSLTGHGTIVAVPIENFTTRGFEYYKEEEPDTVYLVDEEGDFGVGSYELSIVDLDPVTKYFYRAKASYLEIIAYGDWIAFITTANPNVNLIGRLDYCGDGFNHFIERGFYINSVPSIEGGDFETLSQEGNFVAPSVFSIPYKVPDSVETFFCCFGKNEGGQEALGEWLSVYIEGGPSGEYTVTYDGNGATGGEPPVDSNIYSQGDLVTVLDKGTLVRSGMYFVFVGWNTVYNGTGISYFPGQTFNMGIENVILYAQWSGMW